MNENDYEKYLQYKWYISYLEEKADDIFCNISRRESDLERLGNAIKNISLYCDNCALIINNIRGIPLKMNVWKGAKKQMISGECEDGAIINSAIGLEKRLKMILEEIYLQKAALNTAIGESYAQIYNLQSEISQYKYYLSIFLQQ